MGTNVKGKIYIGKGGFRGMSEVRRSSWLERNAGPTKKPQVYGGGVSSRVVLSSGGIANGGTVRVSGAASPSEKSRVFVRKVWTTENREVPRKSALTEIKMVGREAREIEFRAVEEKRRVQPPMTEREKRAADYFEQMMSRRLMPMRVAVPMPEKGTRVEGAKDAEREAVGAKAGSVEAEVKGEAKAEAIRMPEFVAVPKTGEEVVEEPKLEVSEGEVQAVLSGQPLGEKRAGEQLMVGGRKRGRGKKSRKHSTASGEVLEEKLAERQAEADSAEAAATVE
ncbi:MAG: hypothetical protein ACI4CE_07525 [Methanomethylophilus alvi]